MIGDRGEPGGIWSMRARWLLLGPLGLSSGQVDDAGGTVG
jgi:hypothetical protein